MQTDSGAFDCTKVANMPSRTPQQASACGGKLPGTCREAQKASSQSRVGVRRAFHGPDVTKSSLAGAESLDRLAGSPRQ